MTIKVDQLPIEFGDDVRVVADKNVAFCTLGDGVALLDMRTGIYYSLNAVAAHIWSALQSPITVSDLCGLVVEQFDVSEVDCRQDVLALMSDMARTGLVGIRHADVD